MVLAAVCTFDKDGLPVTTLDGEGSLAVNHTMRQSLGYLNILPQIGELRALGASIFRL